MIGYDLHLSYYSCNTIDQHDKRQNHYLSLTVLSLFNIFEEGYGKAY